MPQAEQSFSARAALRARPYYLQTSTSLVRIAAAVLAVALAVPIAPARNLVTLHSGFTMEADRVETAGAQVILHHNGGQITFDATEVASVTPLPDAPAAPVAASAAISPTPAPTTASVPDLIREAARREGLPEAFVRSVAEAESALRPDAVSPKGARGVMQLMPDTARALGVADPHNPAENIRGGARLLRELLQRYQNHPDQVHRALAAYNAGAGAVAKYGGVPPYKETQTYIHRVLRRYQQASMSNRPPAAPSPQSTSP